MRGSVRDLTVKVDVDVSEAITGLKALQREAKEATKALREYESTAQRLKAHMDANGAEYYEGIRKVAEKTLAEDKRKYSLDELLSGITEENRHEPIDFTRRSYE